MSSDLNLRDFDALTFDCYGTLIDWERGILEALRPWTAAHRLESPSEELLVAFAESESGHEAATPAALYRDILRAVLADLAGRYGVVAGAEECRAFGDSVRDWPAFPDSPAALQYLEQHFKLVIISNVDRASFEHSRKKLGVQFDAVVTAEDVGSYKPDPRNFEYGLATLRRLGVERERVLHVAQSLYHDHEPAKKLGMRTVWINRRAGQVGWGATRAPRSDVQPDLTVNSLAELVELHAGQSGQDYS